jgi:signal peptidase II
VRGRTTASAREADAPATRSPGPDGTAVDVVVEERPGGGARLARFGAVVALIVLDLWTKSAMFRWLAPVPGQPRPDGVEVWSNGHWRYTVVDPWFGFMLGENYGAAWGFGAEHPYLLIGGRVAAVCLIAWLLWRASPRPRAVVWALTLVLAGALGNLYDNLFRPRGEGRPFGAVRDFIDVYFPRWDYHFPTFNVADSCITVGAVLLVASALFPARARATAVAARPDAAAPDAPPPG